MNDEFLLEQLSFICNRLNDEEIDYYVVGALGGYIDCNLEITRKHDDIDIMILEKEIEKLYDVFKNSDYIFIDNRKHSNKTLNDKGFTEGDEHEVYAQYKYNNFHIGFFMYSRTNETYSIIEYFKEDGNQRKLIRTLPIRYFEYQYDNNYKTYKEIKLKTVRVECIYNNKKKMDREKDKYDNSIYERYIDDSIIQKMSGKSKYRVTKIETI